MGTLPAVSLLTAILAFVMIVNNYFGFTGLQNFAQYVAVPVIVVWGVYATDQGIHLGLWRTSSTPCLMRTIRRRS